MCHGRPTTVCPTDWNDTTVPREQQRDIPMSDGESVSEGVTIGRGENKDFHRREDKVERVMVETEGGLWSILGMTYSESGYEVLQGI